eukprot:TRINITY_DN4827_c0_g2_i4.p1 TRINITY_DN4827_c0_g2~~TRINITY_DN4827_c0_g2_i4.p1  ORF type:complete len:206 (+),score=40.93 TRINITY_DN4827_c0_g2_i4:310-927(+)
MDEEQLAEAFPHNLFIQRGMSCLEAIGWHKLPEVDCVWIQAMQPAHVTKCPSHSHPLVQTYLDVQLERMIELFGTDFAREFLDTTMNSSRHYLNDRLIARRPWIHCPSYKKIDELCASHPPGPLNVFAFRMLEEEYAVTKHKDSKETFHEVKSDAITDWTGRTLGVSGVKDFIFGFGSLINTASRTTSAPASADAIYIRVLLTHP